MSGGRTLHVKSCVAAISRSARSASRRHYATKTLIGTDLGPIESDDQRSFRTRAAGKPLPLPPVLDPVVIAKRSRWEQKKSKPDPKKFTPFQQKLAENPFAHALASPVRICRHTNVLLPSAFFITLSPRPHPKTSDPWLLPVNLTTTQNQLGPTYRFLCRRLVTEELFRRHQWRANLGHRLTMNLGTKVGKLIWREDMPDLITTLLQRRIVCQLRQHFKYGGRKLVACESPLEENLEHVDEVSCVLYFKSCKTPADNVQERANKIVDFCHDRAGAIAVIAENSLDPHKQRGVTHRHPKWWYGPIVPMLQPRLRYPPLDYKTATWRGAKVPVYSLHDLLGEETLREVLAGSRFEGEKCVAVKRARHMVPLQELLFQLQTYVAGPRP